MGSIYPIGFSIPQDKIITTRPIKTKLLSSLIPGDLKTYIYNTEEEYYNEYRSSYFAKTTKKGGWDCMRHYEIMANGCIPYFPDIEMCPETTMTLLPKDLIIEGNKLYMKLQNKIDCNLTEDEKNEYSILQDKILEYTKTTLTTHAMAHYILNETNNTNVTNILYLSGDTSPDYLRCVTLHGFKKRFGMHCHDYPKVPHIYKTNTINYSSLYGKGMSYTNLLDPKLHNDCLDNDIIHAIQNKFFDIVIYGSYHRGMPYYDLVSSIYKPNEVILLCGEDMICGGGPLCRGGIHMCDYSYWANKGHHVFVREL